MVTLTLGTKDDAQRIEVGFTRGPGRREIGHAALAERALLPLIHAETVLVTLRLGERHPGVQWLEFHGYGFAALLSP